MSTGFNVLSEQREKRNVNVDDAKDSFTMMSLVSSRPGWRVDTQTRDEDDSNHLH